MKGFSKSITNRFQPIWKVKNQTGKGNAPKDHQIHVNENQNQHENQYENQYDKTYQPIVQEKFKKRSKKHKKRKREYQHMDC